MLKYDEWSKRLDEFQQGPPISVDAGKIIHFLKNELKPLIGELNIVPDIDKFTREDEPTQTRTIFSDSSQNSFGANFTEDGKLYSIDFYKPNSKGSEVTMYIKKGPVQKIIKLIPVLMKDPKPLRQKDIQYFVAESLLTEAEDKVEVSFNVPPKPEAPIKDKDDLYVYGDPKILFEDLKKYVDMVIANEQPSLVITGSPGVGKTFLVTKELESKGLVKDKDWVHIKGRSTAAGLYIALYENKDKILLIDDCDSVFKNDDAVSILKSALDSYDVREISWLVGKPLVSPSTGQKLPTKFIFNGGAIFISNLPQKKIDYAVKSRSFVLEVALTPEDMLKRMENELPNVYPHIPLPIRKMALKLIESSYKTTENLELSMRSLIKAIKILENVENLGEAKRLIMQQCSYK